MDKVTIVSHIQSDLTWKMMPMMRHPPEPIGKMRRCPGVHYRVYAGNYARLPHAYQYMSEMIIGDDGVMLKNRWG